MERIICSRCKGNGYIKVTSYKQGKEAVEKILQCEECKSQGEVEHGKNDPNVMYVDSNGTHKL